MILSVFDYLNKILIALYQLIKKLRYYGKNVEKSRQKTMWRSQINLERFDWSNLKEEFAKYLICKE